MSRFVTAAVFLVSFAGASLSAQTAVGGQVTAFHDTSMFKPPAGAKVAVVEFEDLECPACAHAFPIVHEAVKHYNIPLVRYDFVLSNIHIWSGEAAVYARYIQDKFNAQAAEEYRREVFASQFKITSKDDLQRFTQQFFTSRNQQVPFVIDPTGQLQKEIDADKALGEKMGLQETPTIVVVTPTHWIQVKDVMQLYSAIDQAEASVASAPAAPHRTVAAKH